MIFLAWSLTGLRALKSDHAARTLKDALDPSGIDNPCFIIISSIPLEYQPSQGQRGPDL